MQARGFRGLQVGAAPAIEPGCAVDEIDRHGVSCAVVELVFFAKPIRREKQDRIDALRLCFRLDAARDGGFIDRDARKWGFADNAIDHRKSGGDQHGGDSEAYAVAAQRPDRAAR